MPQTQIGFARDTNVKPSQGEIATTSDGRDITLGYIRGLLPPRDKLLWLKGFNYEVYEDLLRDDQVKSTYQQRRLALIASEWEVDAGGTSRKDKKAAEFLKEVVANLAPDWDDVTEKIHHGIFYGFGVGECIWGADGAQTYPEAIKVKRQSRFRFWEDGSLRLLTPDNLFEGEVLPERKFWVFNSGSQDHDDPYGTGLAHYLYWPVFFKRNGFRFWANYLETFAQPKKVGKYPPNATESEKRTLLEAMHALNNDSGMILPEGMIVELLEASRAGTADYQGFQDICNKAISKIVLSQTMTTDDGSSLSQSKTHYAVRQDVVKADADLICGSFNRSVVRWLTDWNFPGAAYPKVWRQIEEPEDLDSRVTREKTVFDMGFRPTLEHIEETYGGEWVDTQAQEAQKATPEQELQSLFPADGAAAPDAAEAPAADAGAQQPDAAPDAAFSEFNFDDKAMLLQQIQAAIAAYKIGASLQEMQALKDSLKWELASLPLGIPATDFSEPQSVDFAAPGAKKTKKCTKGYNCGGACISKTKNCLKKLPGQFSTYAEWAIEQAKAGQNNGSPANNAGNNASELSTPPTAQTKSKEEFPSDPESLTYVEALGGSTGAELVRDENGKLWVRKSGANPDHVREEAIANDAYRALGVNVPKGKLYETANGPVQLTEFIEGKTLGELDSKARSAAIPKIQEDFAADALLGNWDVVGEGQDNILVDREGKVWRIDNGGALRYRARGKPKGEAWGEKATEVSFLRDASRNPSTADVFGGMTNEKIKESLAKITPEKEKALLEVLPGELRETVRARLKGMREEQKKPDKSPLRYVTKEEIDDFYTSKYEDRTLTDYMTSAKKSAIYYNNQFSSPEWKKPPPPPSALELAAVNLYTGGAYEEVNRALRKLEATPEEIAFAQRVKAVANSALAQLPKHEGVAYRGVENDLPDEVIDKYRQAFLAGGGTVVEEAYTSSSSKKQGAFGGGNVKYKIHSKQGVKVERFSKFPKEYEVLFAAGTQFKVLDFKKKGKIYHIEMEEI